MSSASFKRPGIKCEKCGMPFPLFLGMPDPPIKIEKLPDPFRAKCYLCSHEAIYPKSAIRTLATEGDH